jgi:hypothetical protein
MDLTFDRGDEIQRMHRHLPANLYKTLHLLFVQKRTEQLFIPIRSIQYLAAIDQREVIFVDGRYRAIIQMAWQNFHPQRRDNIQDPVEYDLVIYQSSANEYLSRLQNEFFKSLSLVKDRHIARPLKNTEVIVPFRNQKKEE